MYVSISDDECIIEPWSNQSEEKDLIHDVLDCFLWCVPPSPPRSAGSWQGCIWQNLCRVGVKLDRHLLVADFMRSAVACVFFVILLPIHQSTKKKKQLGLFAAEFNVSEETAQRSPCRNFHGIATSVIRFQKSRLLLRTNKTHHHVTHDMTPCFLPFPSLVVVRRYSNVCIIRY